MNKRQARAVRECVLHAQDIARVKRKGMPIRDLVELVENFMPKWQVVVFRAALRREVNR